VTANFLLPSSGGGGITVRSTAVQTVENRTVVFVRTSSGFRATPVTTGRTNGDQPEDRTD